MTLPNDLLINAADEVRIRQNLALERDLHGLASPAEVEESEHRLSIGFRALSVSASYAAQEEAEGDGEPAEIGRWALAKGIWVAKIGSTFGARNGESLNNKQQKNPRENLNQFLLFVFINLILN